MREFYQSLSEKDRRRYAGIEALKFGFGGQNYVAYVLGCSRNTVRKGAMEVSGLSSLEIREQIGRSPTEKPRIRQPGGGRKPYRVGHPEIDEQFLYVLQDHTAGDPMNEEVQWTNLREWEIVEALKLDFGVKVSRRVVRQLLKRHNCRRRKIRKRKPLKTEIPNRNEQFEYISQLKKEYPAAGNPVISMDTKKKEHPGNFYRDGRMYTRSELQAYDHDFPGFAEGTVIPHSLYDLRLNVGYVQIGTGRDTGESACDSFRHWRYTYGQKLYPDTTSILVLCDGGGSNSALHYIFKQDLQSLADEIKVKIRIAHYPPYCSKYNPIEHRLFPHMTRACQGVIFTGLEVVTELIAGTRTEKGLKVFVHVIDKVYKTGRKVAKNFKKEMRIVFDNILPKWNYCAIPSSCSNDQVI